MFFLLGLESWPASVSQISVQGCTAQIDQKFSRADPKWGTAYELCLQNMGARQDASGSYSQRYHYDNPKYKACVDKYGYNNANAIDQCMAMSSTSTGSGAKKPSTQTPSCPSGQKYDKTKKECSCENGEDKANNCKPQNQNAQACPTGQVQHNGICMCYVNNKYVEPGYDFQTGKKVCPDDLNTKGNSQQETPPQQQTTNEALYRCMDQMEKQVENCQQQADEAKTSCDEKKSDNKSLADYKNVLGQTNSTLTVANAGTGAATQCAKAGLISSTGVFAIDSVKQDCDEEYDQCVQTCDSIDTEKIKQCLLTIRNDPMTGQPLAQDTSYFSNRFQTITNDLEEAKKDCKVEAKQEKDSLSQLLQSLGQSAQQAKQCECQLSTSGINCASIPSPVDCLPGGKLYGQPACGTWNNSTKCLIGSVDYNSKECVCIRDTNNSICRTLNTNSTPPSFPGINTGGVTGLPVGTATGAGMNIGDFKDQNDPEAIKDKEGNKNSAGFNTPAGGSGVSGSNGGGGSSAAGIGVGEKDDPGAEADGKNSGAFGQLKSIVGNMFGLKKSNGSGESSLGRSSQSGSGGPDFDKWRPKGLRDPASLYGIGGRNTDIWTTMNHRYREKSSSLIKP